MIILMSVEGTTKSGKTWLTQIAVDTSDDLIKQMDDLIKQMDDNYKQLDYERSQLL